MLLWIERKTRNLLTRLPQKSCDVCLRCSADRGGFWSRVVLETTFKNVHPLLRWRALCRGHLLHSVTPCTKNANTTRVHSRSQFCRACIITHVVGACLATSDKIFATGSDTVSKCVLWPCGCFCLISEHIIMISKGPRSAKHFAIINLLRCYFSPLSLLLDLEPCGNRILRSCLQQAPATARSNHDHTTVVSMGLKKTLHSIAIYICTFTKEDTPESGGNCDFFLNSQCANVSWLSVCNGSNISCLACDQFTQSCHFAMNFL